jgi:hypothetical protein
MKSIAKFTFIVVAFLNQFQLKAQVSYNFTSGATASGTIANITANAVTSGNSTITTINALGIPASAGYTGVTGTGNANFIAKTTVFALATSTYAQVTLTPATNYSVSVTGIKWGNFSLNAVGAVASGPTTLSVYASLDNFTTSTLLSTSTVTPNATVWNLLNPAITAFNAPAGTVVTIRIYGTGGTGTIPTGTTFTSANWRLDDIAVTAIAQTGTVGQIPKYTGPATFTNSIITESGTGNIGIGTTTPAQKLDINGTLKTTGFVYLPGTPPVAGQVLTTDVNGVASWQTAPATSSWDLNGNGSTTAVNYIGTKDAQDIRFKTGGLLTTIKLFIQHATGNIGVGTATPATSLDVKGFVGLGNNTATGAGGIIFPSLNGGLSNTGTYIIGEKTGMWGNRMDFYARDAAGILTKNVMSVSGEGAGMLGIGTTTPTEKLHVTGGFRLENGTQGAGKILTSDANGVATWAVVGSGSTTGWGLTGNIVNNSGNDFIGTLNPQPFRMFTSGWEQMRITTAGDVSIGDISPISKLHVYDYTNTPTITIGQAQAPGYKAILQFWAGPYCIGCKEKSKGGDLSKTLNEDAKFRIVYNRTYDITDDRLGFVNEANEEIVTFTSPGNVGIGVIKPTAQFHTTGSVRLAGLLQDDTKNRVIVSDINGNISFRDVNSIAGSGAGWQLGGNNNITGLNNYIGITNTNASLLPLKIGTNSIAAITINSTGDAVLIGSPTTSGVPNQNYILTVGGRIQSYGVKVHAFTAWPDFVFEKDFKLLPLADLEKFILKNKHLPGVMSADEIKKDGIDLEKINNQLLQKVEELTLHILELNKKIEKIENQLNH